MKVRAVVWHWTGGAHTANAVDRRSYHHLIEQRAAGIRHIGGVPVERNLRPLTGIPSAHNDPGGYAAHAGGFNTGTIGVSMCGMRGAVDLRPGRDVVPGPSPITLHQVRALLGVSASFAIAHDLPVTERTFLSHHEVRRVYGVGVAKWDVSWIPGLNLSPDDVGPYLREQLSRWLTGDLIDDMLYAPPGGVDRAGMMAGDEDA